MVSFPNLNNWVKVQHMVWLKSSAVAAATAPGWETGEDGGTGGLGGGGHGGLGGDDAGHMGGGRALGDKDM